MNKYYQQHRYKNNSLENSAKSRGGLNRYDAREVYPSPKRELTLWIRANKDKGEISQRKAIVNAYLVELKFNIDYSNATYTFLNKYTGNKFELDYKYYGKLWWIFI